MNPRKTPPTGGLVGVAMHVLFVFFILLVALEVPSASHAVMGMAAGALALWLAWKSWVRFREWDRRDPLALKKLALAINELALLVGTIAIIRLHLQVEKSRQYQMPTHPTDGMPESRKSTPCGAVLPLSNPEGDHPHSSRQESPRTPCIEGRSRSIASETPESQDEASPCMRHTTTGLRAPCLNSCVESPFFRALKVDQVGREESKRKASAHVNHGKVDPAKWVARLGEKAGVDIENLRSSLMRENRRRFKSDEHAPCRGNLPIHIKLGILFDSLNNEAPLFF